MTPPLLVDSLSLSAFRGVRDELGPLDLTSPITLIYAPNGTGKTSLIDGAEWLLTGNVYRLNELSDDKRSKIEPNELRCKTSQSDVEQRVWGSIQIDGIPKLLIRDEEGWKGDGSTTIKEPELLRLFAPNAVGENVPHQSAPRLRRNWIRGARFLTEATLATLVDTDRDSEDTRQEIMADMLGVRELNERAEKYERYAEVLKGGYRATNHPTVPGISSLEKLLKDKIQALEDLCVSKEDGSAKPSESAVEVVEVELDKAITALKEMGVDISPLSTKETEKIIAQISARHSTESGKLMAQKELLKTVLASWMEIDNFRKELAEKQKEQNNLSKEVSSLEAAISEKKALVAVLKQAIEHAGDRKQSVLAAHGNVKVSLEYFTSAIGELEDAEFSSISSASISDLKALPEAAWDESKFEALAFATSDLTENLDEVDSELQWLSTARLELSELTRNAIDQNALIELKKEVELQGKIVNELSSLYAEQSGPVEDLRLALARFLNADAESSSCPACGHKWENKAALDDALAKTASQVPQHMKILSDELLEAEKKLREEKSVLVNAESFLHSVVLKTQEIKAKENSVENYFERLKELSKNWGWENPAPNKLSISKRLERIGKRIDFGNALVEFFDTLNALMESLGLSEVTHQEVESIGNYYSLLVSQFVKEVEDEINKKTAELSTINSELILKANDLGKNNSLLTSVRNRIGELAPLVGDFVEAWKDLGGGEAITDIELAAVKNRIDTRASALAKTQQHLSAAQAAHESIATEKKAAEIRSEIDALKEKISYLNRKRNLATKAAKELATFSNGYIYRQFDSLSKVFWPIFWRLQANEFYESIEPGPPEAPLRWEAKAMGKKFNPSMHFSMGQRQDFALAIFLARARSLGGTFFLDEPITHLDDLNRVALLDLFRLMAIEPESQSKFVITTASKSLVRHMTEKFASVPRQEGNKPLRVYELDGNPRSGINCKELY